MNTSKESSQVGTRSNFYKVKKEINNSVLQRRAKDEMYQTFSPERLNRFHSKKSLRNAETSFDSEKPAKFVKKPRKKSFRKLPSYKKIPDFIVNPEMSIVEFCKLESVKNFVGMNNSFDQGDIIAESSNNKYKYPLLSKHNKKTTLKSKTKQLLKYRNSKKRKIYGNKQFVREQGIYNTFYKLSPMKFRKSRNFRVSKSIEV
mmetsp:Transcript_1564/g.1535  ORF Transcript_1564/g.1535 Transcript_1564/m.1535 type:complete len:202 (-) Transcript_1564:11-616(-)